MENTDLPPKIGSYQIFPLLLINFINALGFSIVIPFLVFLVHEFGGNAVVYGFAASAYPAFELIGAPIIGAWSDRVGRRRALLLSQIGTLLSWGIFILAFLFPISALISFDSDFFDSFFISLPLIILFLARSLDGLTGGNISVTNAYLADISNDDNRKGNFGKMSAASGLGFILGPAVAGILGGTIYGEIVPVITALLISMAGVMAIVFWLPESKKISTAEKKHKKRLTWKEMENMPFVRFMLLLYFLIYLGFNFFYTAFPVFALDGLKWTVTQMGLFFSILSLMMVIVQGPVLSRISGKFSDITLILVGAFILGINFLLLSSGKVVLIYLAAFFFAVGNGIMWPSFLSLLAVLAGKKYQGAIQGLGGSLGSLASIIGLIMGGFLYDMIQAKTFAVAAVIIFLVFILSFRLLPTRKKVLIDEKID
ncbi:MFS transporter [Fulvivirgaceae bacterium BMA10]|uniref:MFS transporter n=1 Tax=Splendidivirga corallicola TaxID=3051826 RepID=A0ABT8KKC8_9BACT|nr:MFS transporter [Fulvivirgaceae bacterium BMA10]